MSRARHFVIRRDATRKKVSTQRTTIVDVARAAGVSVATASNAINNQPSVRPRTKERVDLAALRLGYTPNVYARRMRTTGVRTIGFFSTFPYQIPGGSTRHSFVLDMAAITAVTAIQNDLALLLVPQTLSDPTSLNGLAIDGALVVEPTADDPYIQQLRTRKIPFVTIGSPPFSSAYVDTRTTEAAVLMLDHLVKTSARHIVLLVGRAERPTQSKIEAAYTSFCAQRRLKAQVVRVDDDRGEDAAYSATVELVKQGHVDAIFAPFDAYAVAAVRALNDLKVRIPQEIRVATRNDGNRARDSHPPITAVDLHLDVVAQLAIDLLLRQLRDGISVRRLMAPPPTLVERQSTRVAARTNTVRVVRKAT